MKGFLSTITLVLAASWSSAQEFARSNFRVDLPAPQFATNLLRASPFGINTAFRPGTTNLLERIEAMQRIGIKWGRQDFTWREIEKAPGVYDWSGYDRLVDLCLQHGLLLFGNFAYAPAFHDPRTENGAEAYARFAAEGAKRYAGKVDDWQIWNEPNGGFWKGSPEEYARLLARSGEAIHQANPKARVLGLNMAFCDVLWAEKILNQVPYESFDVACFHPYRPPNAPEDQFDWWELDQYVKSWHKHDLKTDYPLVRMSYLQQAGELRKLMSGFGAPKPMWVTEICWNTHLHPYGTSELRQADLLVRCYLLSVSSGLVDKVFWWTLKDGGTREFDQADMVGLMRADLSPKYSYYAYGWMTRMLEGKKWIRNDSFGPELYISIFGEEGSEEELMVGWATKPFAYARVTNSEKGLTFYDLFGTKRFAPFDKVRTSNLPVPFGESPIYIVGKKGFKAAVRPDPGW